MAQFADHKSTVWRLCWNITGTTLASTGDDGCVRLWRCKLHIILKLYYSDLSMVVKLCKRKYQLSH